ncbi:DUF1080 domain-containing protein [Maribacter sp. 2210JD10-5]|uniref:3-keto-disaccharide hydrolase n=1 Tax=Maribacter sp. 2210JD10-5 TaxID=3386272 RepID=UPI0039BC7C89
MKKNTSIALILLCAISTYAQDKDWTPLLDKQLSKWDKYIGVPHTSVKGIDWAPKGNGVEGTALGLNVDPLNVFSIKKENGEQVLYITGEIYGGLTSKEIYENYHLKFDFKWGEKKWEPRLKDKRDNGVLYHCNGEHGAFWNVWMESQEFQVQEGDMGDYFGLAGGVNTIKVSKNKDNFYEYDENGIEMRLGTVIKGKYKYRGVRNGNYEKPNGEWNTLELICFDGTSYHIVNGKIVNVLTNAERRTEVGYERVTRGKIQIQSEAAEAYYRKIMIKELRELPSFLRIKHSSIKKKCV